MLRDIATGVVHWLDTSAEWVVTFIIVIGLTQNIIALIQLFVAARALREKAEGENSELLWQQRAPSAPPISLIAPAYNESASIVESTKSMLNIHYPHCEIIIVNDGSTDDTLEKLKKHFSLRKSSRDFEPQVQHKSIKHIYQSKKYANLVVIDKDNGGKADALNAGINVSRSPLFCSVDADSMLDSDALLHAVQPFLSKPDSVIAVGGTIRVANGCRVRGGKVLSVGLAQKLLPMLQTVEYTRAFLIARVAMSEMGVMTLISGAFGIFRRQAAIAAGGYSTDTVGEDYELVMRMHRYHLDRKLKYEVVFVAEPVCWTEVPETLAVLGRQRRRWQRGSLETFFRHWRMLCNPRYGKVGLIGMPFSLLVDVFGPLVEVIGYLLVPILWLSGMLNFDYMLAFLALTFVSGIFISAGSLALEEISLHRIPKAKDLLRLIGGILIENFGYRQLNNIWRAHGWWEYLRKKKSWGEMTRTGFQSSRPD